MCVKLAPYCCAQIHTYMHNTTSLLHEKGGIWHIRSGNKKLDTPTQTGRSHTFNRYSTCMAVGQGTIDSVAQSKNQTLDQEVLY